MAEDKLIQDRLDKLQKLKEMGIEPYPYSYEKSHSSAQILEEHLKLNAGEETKKKVKVAGRLMTLRVMGNAAFAHISDNDGSIQVYFSKDHLGESYQAIKKLVDLGDFLGVEGNVFRTKMGEITVKVHAFTFLSKSIRPLPDKYHGLQDPEIKYRKRYLDLLTDKETKNIFVLRGKIISAIRAFLEGKGFVEVDTPTLQPVYGGARAKPFKTHINAWNMDLFLSISPELYLKRLIVGGMERVYCLAKNFRNEGVDRTHNPEFTMMECYWAYKDYHAMMELTEDLYEFVCMKVLGTTKVVYQDQEIDFKKPWRRISMKDAIKEYAKMNVDDLDDDKLQEILKEHKIVLHGGYTRGLAIEALFEEFCEDKLIQPTFVMHHPRDSTPLCKQKRDEPELLERFEPFVMGWEIGNAYSELNDPLIQRKLFEEQAKRGRGGDEEAQQMDEDFLEAVEYGMPPCGGLGLGIDRMVILLTNAQGIRDVIAFPTMKPKND